MKEAIITLPGRPVPKKNSPILVKNRAIILPSKQYREYEKRCLKELLIHRFLRFTGRIHLHIEYWLPDKRWWPDLTGLIQATQDILQKAKIIDDDKNVVCLDGTRIAGLDKDNPRTEVKIREV